MKIFKALTRTSLALAVAGAVVLGGGFVPGDARAADGDKRELTAADIPALVRAVAVKDLKASLYRFDASMNLMSGTRNRDDFLINRDELWRSREELSYAVKALEDDPGAAADAKISEIVTLTGELLLKCEDFANNQNEIIAKYNNYVDGPEVFKTVFKNLAETERLASSKELSAEDETKYVQITSARGAYEIAIEELFKASSVAEMTEVVARVQKTHENYSNLIGANAKVFPEMKGAFEEANNSFKKLFANKGYGSEYYSYLQLKEAQDATNDYYRKTLKELLKTIGQVENGLKAKLM